MLRTTSAASISIVRHTALPMRYVCTASTLSYLSPRIGFMPAGRRTLLTSSDKETLNSSAVEKHAAERRNSAL